MYAPDNLFRFFSKIKANAVRIPLYPRKLFDVRFSTKKLLHIFLQNGNFVHNITGNSSNIEISESNLAFNYMRLGTVVSYALAKISENGALQHKVTSST